MPEILIQQIERLTPYWDRIVRRPLTEAEIKSIEHGVGLPMPFGLQTLLRRVGLFQDLLPHLFSEPEEFLQAGEFLTSLLGERGADLFPFAGDREGHYFCLELGDPAESIMKVDQSRAMVMELDDTLGDWVVQHVDHAVDNIEERVCNSRKYWHVQFSFATDNDRAIAGMMHSIGLLQKEDVWVPVETSAAGVRRFIMLFRWGQETITLNRLEYSFRHTPVFSMDLREPIAAAMGDSKIKRLRRLFKRAEVGCKVISYGPLAEEAA